VPAGAACDTRKEIGPGTPYAEDASKAMIAALRRFDFEDGGAEAAHVALKEARPRDVLSVWHVFRRADTSVREEARGMMIEARVGDEEDPRRGGGLLFRDHLEDLGAAEIAELHRAEHEIVVAGHDPIERRPAVFDLVDVDVETHPKDGACGRRIVVGDEDTRA